MTRRTLSLASALLLLFAGQAWGMEKDPFLREIASVPRTPGKDRVNISDVATRHIPPGTALQEALRFVKERGFKVLPHQGKDVPKEQKWFYATKLDSYKVVLAEETRVIIESDGNQVLKTRAWVFLKGL